MRHHSSSFPPPQPPCRDKATSPQPVLDDDSREQTLQNLCAAGELDGALEILSHSRCACLPATYISLLRACNKSKALRHCMCVHAHLLCHGTRIEGSLGEHLVIALASCGALDDAAQASARLPSRTDASWTALISAYADGGCLPKAVEMYRAMQDDGVEPNRYTFVNLIKSCGRSVALEMGKMLHGEARTKNLASDLHVVSALLTMYERCGAVVEAECTFSATLHRDIVIWNTMLSLYVKQCQPEKALHLYRQLQEEGLAASRLTVVVAVQACGCLTEKQNNFSSANLNINSSKAGFEIICGLCVDFQRMGIELDALGANTLVSAYGKCGAINYACNSFLSLKNCTTISWNTMLTVFVTEGSAYDALQLYRQMHVEGASPDELTFVLAFQACGVLLANTTLDTEKCLHIVKALHTDICSTLYRLDGLVATPLMNLYGKLGSLDDAEAVFVAVRHQDVVMWTALLSTYVEHQQAEQALQVYAQMQKQGPVPNPLTHICALGACGMLAESRGTVAKVSTLSIGRLLHIDACLRGFTSYVFVATALACMYTKCNALFEAENVFFSVPYRDTAAWNAMLSALVALEQGEKALLLFQAMSQEEVIVDDGTMVSILQASIRAASFQIIGQLHFVIVCGHFDGYPSVSGSLINAYCSTGSMHEADACFCALPKPDIEVFTACVHGHALQGNATVSMALIEGLKATSEKIDEIVLTSALTSLTHGGLVHECIDFFYFMMEDRSTGINRKHFAILVDLFGRAGDFKRIDSLIAAMPMEKLPAIWKSLLGACHSYGNVELSSVAFDYAMRIAWKEEPATALLSNASAVSNSLHNGQLM